MNILFFIQASIFCCGDFDHHFVIGALAYSAFP